MKKIIIFMLAIIALSMFVGCSKEISHNEIPVKPGQSIEEVIKQKDNNQQKVSKEYQQEVEFNSKRNVGC